MDERNLDRAIDIAAGRLIGREPSGALSHEVMVRIRKERPHAPRRFVWATAAASVLLCVVITFSFMNRVPLTVATLPRTLQLQVPRPAVPPDPPLDVAHDTAFVRSRAVVLTARTTVPSIDMTAREVSRIEPIDTDPIDMSAIDLPQLEREATLIDTLEIEPLSIEPLTASND